MSRTTAPLFSGEDSVPIAALLVYGAGMLKATITPARSHVDIKAIMIGDLGERRSFVGRAMRCGEAEFIVDSVSDIGDGWWRLRLIPFSAD